MNSQTAQELDPFRLIVEMLQRSSTPLSNFPATELYSEGWMVRLLAEISSRGLGGLPFRFPSGVRWYSEARLASAFLPRRRNDPLAESHTHADLVVGDFAIGTDTRAGVLVDPDAQHLAVVEAKMMSKLGAGTTKVKWFDQAARNVAAMAWTAYRSGLLPDGFTAVEFAVVAPVRQIELHDSFSAWTSPQSIESKVCERIALYRDDSERMKALVEFRDSFFVPFLTHLKISLVSWEELIATTDPAVRAGLGDFYGKCLEYN